MFSLCIPIKENHTHEMNHSNVAIATKYVTMHSYNAKKMSYAFYTAPK